jgi:hypothetical protein
MRECFKHTGFNPCIEKQHKAAELMRNPECIEFLEKVFLPQSIQHDNRVEIIKNNIKTSFTEPSLHFKSFLNNGSMSLWRIYYKDLSYGRTKTGCILSANENKVLYNFNHEYMKYTENDSCIFYGEQDLYQLSKKDFTSKKTFTPTAAIHSLSYDAQDDALYVGTSKELLKISSGYSPTVLYKSDKLREHQFCKKIPGTNFIFLKTNPGGYYRVHTETKEITPLFVQEDYRSSRFSDSGQKLCIQNANFDLIMYNFNDNLHTYVDPQVLFNSTFDNSNNHKKHRYASAFKFLPHNDTILFVSITDRIDDITRHYISIFDTTTSTLLIDIEVDCHINDFSHVGKSIWAISYMGDFYTIPYKTLIGYHYLKQAVTQNQTNEPLTIKTHKTNGIDINNSRRIV